MLRAATCLVLVPFFALPAILVAGESTVSDPTSEPSSAAAPAPAELLFSDLQPISDAAPSSPAAVAEYRVNLALARLPVATRLAMPLPGGSQIGFERTIFQGRSGGYTWVGRLAQGDGSAVLTVHDGLMSGIVFTPTRTFQILPEEGGGQRLAELDTSRFPPCAGGEEARGAAASGPWRAPEPRSSEAVVPRLDVMVVYTTAAKNLAGGQAAIETIIQNAVDITNVAYGNSNIEANMQLVHTAEVSYVHDGSFSNALNWLASDATVAQMRDAKGADMVSMLVNGGGSCGIGFVQRNPGAGFAGSAFQVTEISCAVGNLSFAHEFGHNEGCEHNPENGPSPGVASFVWSFGHWNNGSYRTVMSYSNPCTSGCTRQPYFSNSNVSFNGLPTGILDTRENYRTINFTAPIVEAFRQQGLLSDGFESGDLSAWTTVGP